MSQCLLSLRALTVCVQSCVLHLTRFTLILPLVCVRVLGLVVRASHEASSGSESGQVAAQSRLAQLFVVVELGVAQVVSDVDAKGERHSECECSCVKHVDTVWS